MYVCIAVGHYSQGLPKIQQLQIVYAGPRFNTQVGQGPGHQSGASAYVWCIYVNY